LNNINNFLFGVGVGVFLSLKLRGLFVSGSHSYLCLSQIQIPARGDAKRSEVEVFVVFLALCGQIPEKCLRLDSFQIISCYSSKAFDAVRSGLVEV
jgi:hypothetical protein